MCFVIPPTAYDAFADKMVAFPKGETRAGLELLVCVFWIPEQKHLHHQELTEFEYLGPTDEYEHISQLTAGDEVRSESSRSANGRCLPPALFRSVKSHGGFR
jgi:hypothetical protein